MRLDCHAHTRVHSACSSLDPDLLCRLAVARGLDGLVLTEHHQLWTGKDLELLQADHPALALYAGIELTLAERHDVVLIAPPDLLLRQEVDWPGQTLEELARKIAPVRSQVFSFVAHPFRYSDHLSPALLRILQWVDGIEMNSVNLLKGGAVLHDGFYAPMNWTCYARAQEEAPRIALYNTDCHHPPGVGVLANELPGPPPADEAGLVRRLRAGQIVQWQHREALAQLFGPVY